MQNVHTDTLCTPDQAEDYNTQGNHTIIPIEPELCNERAITKSSISNPLLSQGEVMLRGSYSNVAPLYCVYNSCNAITSCI